MIETTGRSLTIGAFHGFSNRLRPLLSGLVLAEATQRRFTMLWPRNGECAAAFSELFINDWPVQEAPLPDVMALCPYPPLLDILTASEAHLAFRLDYWLLAPAVIASHAALLPRYEELLRALQPVPAVADQVAEFRATHFRPQMIGVHLRRGDYVSHRMFGPSANNLRSSFRAVNRLLRQLPEAGILLCSDDGAIRPRDRTTIHLGVHQAYRRRYGERVVWRAPRSLDRAQKQAIQDAVVDLWLLRSTDAFVGTLDSTFSELAAYGRHVPTLLAGPDDWRYRVATRVLTMTGIARLMRQDMRRRLGWDLSVPGILRRYLGRLRNGATHR